MRWLGGCTKWGFAGRFGSLRSGYGEWLIIGGAASLPTVNGLLDTRKDFNGGRREAERSI